VACAKQDDDGPVAVSPFSTVTEHYGQRSLMRLEGELDVCGTDRLRRAMADALHRAPKTLVADLSALGFADCAGLAVLVWAHESLAGHGRELIITGCQPSVRRLLSLTGFDMYLHVSDEPADTFLVQGGGAGRGTQYAPFGIIRFLPP
jgi:anti-sigma B factor antagonist